MPRFALSLGADPNRSMTGMFAPSVNVDLSKLSQAEEPSASNKKVTAKGSRGCKSGLAAHKSAKKP